MVDVTISETFDLRTKVGKMTLIGIHTPSKTLIQKTYPGLVMNSRFCRIKSMDVVLSAVSNLPISPDQVGTDATQIAPEDMLNPILYTAVSNDSMTALQARLYGLNGTDDEVGDMVKYTPNHVTDASDEFNIYYALLQNRAGFKLAHPQEGLSMKGLKPLVYDRYYNFGINTALASPDTVPDYAGATLALSTRAVQSMRGRAHPMPRFNTSYITVDPNSNGTAANIILPNGVGDGDPKNAQATMPEILPVYCGMILMPPSKRTLMYYRMRVTCHLSFEEIRPIQDIANFYGLALYGQDVYHSDYTVQSSKMSSTTDLVDTENADIEKIMEGR